MDHFKFELIRASAAQEITHSRSTKFAAVTASELVEAFADFALGCGYQRESLAEAFAEFTDDEFQPPEINSKPTPNFSQIGSSLVERVAATLHAVTDTDPNVPPGEWAPEARAAIREVNAWLRERAGGARARWLLDNEIESTPTSQED
jgi:hypothetical protein